MENLKVLIDSFSNVKQNESGGISMRIDNFLKNASLSKKLEIKLFNKWEDKLEDCDILHVFKATLDTYSMIVKAKSIGKKVVLSSIVAQEGKYRIMISRLMYRILPVMNTHSILRESLFFADVVVAQTQKEANFIMKYYEISKEKIRVVPNGVKTSLIDYYNIYGQLNKEIVLCVGRFDENKNQLSIIRALKQTMIPVHFVGGASSEDEEYYSKCINESTDNMKFHGWLSSDSAELAKLFYSSKVVVLASHKEIFGNSLIEGGACGANLVVTKELPIEEWGLKGRCYQIDSKSIDSIKNGIVNAYNSPCDNEISEYIISKFSWDAVISDYEKIYSELVGI